MEIFPNSTVVLLRGVPLDNTYTDTVRYASTYMQEQAFLAYNPITFNKQTYQRVNRGYLRLQICADDIYNYNYLMFKNTSYGDKWFYAFITQIDYLNDNTSEIRYEIDVMQTWATDIVLRQCYVEREHSSSDLIGEHLVPEPVDTGNIICNDVVKSGHFDSYMVAIAMTDTGVS